VSPRNEPERQLVSVLEEVLKKQPVGIKDNFFVLGGDSIKSIQVVSRLKQRGYSLTIRDILLYPVVEELARRIKTVSRAAAQGLVEGPVPLSPIQASFFQSDFHEKQHYNQSVLLQSKAPLSEAGIRAALEKIVLHHDALRMVYRKTETGWEQENRGREQGYSLEVIESDAAAATEESDRRLADYCDRFQSGMQLERGPLFRAALFRNTGGQGSDHSAGDYLLLVAHHLVIDGVSWRILFEDLSGLYGQYLAGEPLSLPLKTDSFQYWQQEQLHYSRSERLLQEEGYWSEIESVRITPLPVDNPQGSNRVKDTVSRSFLLDAETT
ncbi:MAG: condensation domain-containing protein, partial [Chitinophaga rupis]